MNFHQWCCLTEETISAIDAKHFMCSLTQPDPCEDAVSRKAVEEMLKNGFPARGMWEIEGDVVKQTVCETLADALMDLERLPSVTPKEQPEIIRCQDCKYYIPYEWMFDGITRSSNAADYAPDEIGCSINDHNYQPDGFCSCAERREGGDK